MLHRQGSMLGNCPKYVCCYGEKYAQTRTKNIKWRRLTAQTSRVDSSVKVELEISVIGQQMSFD